MAGKEMLMKIRIFALVLVIGALFSGCAVGMERLEAVPNQVERLIDSAGNAVESAAMNTTATQPATTTLTREEAEAIALEHAGLASDQVSYLRTDYEIDDGVPQYEVEFHYDRWEYDYEINAQTGAILSYDRDD